MPLQARAEATRRRILDSAVDLFDELGYGETGLADVLQRAGVSKGAFYYHFDSKEAVATAVIEEYRRRNAQFVLGRSDASAPLLDQIITATFASAALLEEDKAARVANQLLQALSQISGGASRLYAEWTSKFISSCTAGLQAVGVRNGVDAAEVAEAIWAGVVGCHLLSAALGDDPYARLARAWRAVVYMTIPEDLTGHYREFLDRVEWQHQKVG